MPKQGSVMPAENLVMPIGSRAKAWIESMRASSPTRTNIVPTIGISTAHDDAFNYWKWQHPSALASFGSIVEGAKGKTVALFLDYDGTLSPIVTDPDHAFMSDCMRAAVKEAAKLFPTAIVSGRGTDKVYNFVKLSELYYAGSHGMDIKGPSKASKHSKPHARFVRFQPAKEFLSTIDEVNGKLIEKIKTIEGSKVENNKFCLSVHFRCVDEKKWSTLADQVKTVLKDYPKLHLTEGRKVLEIRPSIKWDKGKALEFLLDSLGFADCNDIFPIYIGDDRTDEDAFKALDERRQGIGILVSLSPKETRASYSLQDPAEVMDFLHCLVDWKLNSK